MANWSSDLDWWSIIVLSHHCRCFHMVILSNSCFSCCSVPGCYVAASSRMVTPLHIAPQEHLRSIGSQFLPSMYNTWLISNMNPHPVLNPRFVVNREFIVNPQFVVNGEFIIIPQFFVNPQFDVNGEFQPLIHRQSRIHRQRRIYRQTWICPQFSIHRESPIHQFVVNQRTSPNGCLSRGVDVSSSWCHFRPSS